MGFREGNYATVWEVSNKGDRFTKIRVSTSRKDKDGEYFTDFSGFVSLVGDAHKKAGQIEKALKNADRVRIKFGATDTTNTYKQEEKREYVNYTLFDFEMADSSGSSSGSGEAKEKGAKATAKKSAAKRGTKRAPAKKSSPSLEDDEDEDGEETGGEQGEEEDGELPF